MDLNPIAQQIWLPQLHSSRFCVITKKKEWINSYGKDSALVRSGKGGVCLQEEVLVVDPSCSPGRDTGPTEAQVLR